MSDPLATTNTLLTPSIIAREALMQLYNNLVMARLVHRDYSSEFQKVGETITVKRPTTFESKDFVQGTGIEPQNVTEDSVSVTLNKWKDVSFVVTSKELSLSIQDFSAQTIRPAMAAHAQAIDADLMALYKDVPYRVGTAATTPDALEDIANCRKSLNLRAVPTMDRRLVVDPEADAKFSILDAIANAEKSGSTAALREAELGRIQGFNLFMSQNIASHTTGGDACAVDLPGSGYAAGVSTIHVDGLDATFAVGDLITIGGYEHVITAVANYSAGDEDITIYPALQAAVVDGDAITVVASHTANLAFHRNAFALVSRPLEPPMDGSRWEQLDYEGLTVRAVYAYNAQFKTNIVSLDILYGVKTLDPRLACRLLG